MNVRATPSEAAKLLPASSAPNVEKDQNISLDDVQTFRQNAIANGYALIRVRSRSKAPLAREWQLGDQPKALSDVRPDASTPGYCSPACAASTAILMIRSLPLKSCGRRICTSHPAHSYDAAATPPVGDALPRRRGAAVQTGG